VTALQTRPEVGAIFTRPESQSSMDGIVPGTLSFNVARWNHARSADILVSGNWNRDRNDAGFAGKTTQGGVAGHGTSSPYDVHNTLIAAGPDFRERTVSTVPTSNVDIAPTILKLLGLPIPASMTGRSIDEALRTGPAIASVRVGHRVERARSADGAYEVEARISTAAGHSYLDDTEVRRPRAGGPPQPQDFAWAARASSQ
jgi:arylsulfatase A-like enzyme